MIKSVLLSIINVHRISLSLILFSRLIWGLTQTGFEILDLQNQNNGSLFALEAAAWDISPQLGSSNASTCSSTWLLGGYGVVGTALTTLTRKYNSLPAHDMVYFSAEIWMIDLDISSAVDLFEFYFDGVLAKKWSFLSGTTFPEANKCGGPQKEYYGTQVYGRVPHSLNEITFTIVKMAMASPGSNNFTLGFRDIQLLFKTTSSTETSSICQFKNLAGTNISCECIERSYDSVTDSVCHTCNSLCYYCYGSTSNDCYACDSKASWNGQSCFQCDTTCDKCNGIYSTNCTRCPTGKILHPNSTCLSSCNSPMITQQTIGGEICQVPCSTGSFLYWDGSCNSTCAPPLKQTTNQDSILLCELPCNETLNEYYSPETQACQIGCDLPYVIQQTDLMKICTTPTPTSTNTSNEESSLQLSGVARTLGNIGDKINVIGSILRPSNPNSVFMVSIAKLIRYVIFIQVPITDDIRQALGSSKSSVFSLSTTFTYQMPQSLKYQFTNENVPAPFTGNITNASFLYNNWEPISTFIILFLIGVFFSVFENFANKTQKKVLIEIARRLRILTKWNFVLLIFFNSYDNLAIYTIIEFQTIQTSSNLSRISVVTCILTDILAVYLLWVLFKVCREALKRKVQIVNINMNKQEDSSTIMETCQVLYAGFKDDSFLKQNYLLLSTVRIIVYYILVGCLYNAPLIQTTQLTIISLVMMIYLIKQRPFRDNFNLFVSLVYELLILTANICIMTLAILDSSGNLTTDSQLILSDTILIVNTTVEFCSNAFMWIYVLLAAKSAFKASKLSLRGKTTWMYVPIVAYESPGMDFCSEDLLEEVRPKIILKKVIEESLGQAKQVRPRRYKKIESILVSNSPSGGESDFEFIAKNSTTRKLSTSLGVGIDRSKGETTSFGEVLSLAPLSIQIKKQFQNSQAKIASRIPLRQLSDMKAQEDKDSSETVRPRVLRLSQKDLLAKSVMIQPKIQLNDNTVIKSKDFESPINLNISPKSPQEDSLDDILGSFNSTTSHAMIERRRRDSKLLKNLSEDEERTKEEDLIFERRKNAYLPRKSRMSILSMQFSKNLPLTSQEVNEKNN